MLHVKENTYSVWWDNQNGGNHATDLPVEKQCWNGPACQAQITDARWRIIWNVDDPSRKSYKPVAQSCEHGMYLLGR